MSYDNIESNFDALVLLNLLNSLQKRDKMLNKARIYLFSPTHLMNLIKHEHSYKILFIILRPGLQISQIRVKN